MMGVGWPLADGPFEAGAMGLVIQSAPSIEAWLEYGQRIRKVDVAFQWVVGDWLNYGEATYGEMYSQGLALWPETDYQRLADYKWVSKAIGFSFRNDRLSWTHHRVVAKLAPQEASDWLATAEEMDLSASALRAELNGKHEVETHACPECGTVHRRKG